MHKNGIQNTIIESQLRLAVQTLTATIILSPSNKSTSYKRQIHSYVEGIDERTFKQCSTRRNIGNKYVMMVAIIIIYQVWTDGKTMMRAGMTKHRHTTLLDELYMIVINGLIIQVPNQTNQPNSTFTIIYDLGKANKTLSTSQECTTTTKYHNKLPYYNHWNTTKWNKKINICMSKIRT